MAPGPDIDRIFQAMADPTRRAILERLGTGPQSISALAEPLGVTLTAVSQHLRVLEACSLAQTRKVGRVRSCRLDTRGFDALEAWVRDRRQVWNARLDRLGEIAAEDDG